eukprot:359741_1
MAYSHHVSLVLKLPTFILAIISLIGSIYVCFSAYMLRRLRQLPRKRNITKPFVITHLVFWMSFSDIMINIWILLVWIPPIMNLSNYYPINICKIIGAFGQFFFVASSCFYCVIIYVTWIMVTAAYSMIVKSKQTLFTSIPLSNAHNLESNVPYQRMNNDNDQTKNNLTQKLNKIVIRGGIFSISMAIILTCVPFIGDSYGYVYNVSTYEYEKFECWITVHYYQLCLYIPILIYMLFALILTLYSIYRVRKIAKVKANKNFNKTKKGLLIRRLLSFTIIFILTWIFPLIYGILWPFIIKQSNP